MAASKSTTSAAKRTKSGSAAKKTAAGRSTAQKKSSTAAKNKARTGANSRKTIPVSEPQMPVYSFPLMKEILVIVALGFAILLFFSCFQKPGSSLSWMQESIFFLFGCVSYVIPFFVFFTICFIISNYGNRGLWIRVAVLCVFLAALCSIVSLLTLDAGVIGKGITELLIPVFGAIGTYIIMIVVIVIGIVLFSGKSLVRMLKKNTLRAYETVKAEQELLRMDHQISVRERELAKEREKSRRMMEQRRRMEELEAEKEREIARRNELVQVRGIGDVTIEPDDDDLEQLLQKKRKKKNTKKRTEETNKREESHPMPEVVDEDTEKKAIDEFIGEIHFGSQYDEPDVLIGRRDRRTERELEHLDRIAGEETMAADAGEVPEEMPWSTDDIRIEEDDIVNQAMDVGSQDEPEKEDADDYEIWIEPQSPDQESCYEDEEPFYLNPEHEILFENGVKETGFSEGTAAYADEIAINEASLGSPYEQVLSPDPVDVWDAKNTYSNTSPREQEENRTKTVRTASGKVISVELDTLPGERKLPAEAKKREVAEKHESSIVPVEYVEPKEYIFPPLELLKRGSNGGTSREELSKRLKDTALKLQQTLQTFGVGVTVTNISCGPSVTRYELQPEMGVKVSKIVSLADDIKLNLAAEDIRIEAPIPGKAAIGIEVPNKEKQSVMLRDLLESEEFKKHGSRVVFAAGKDIAGSTILADIAKMPHLLVAGATGSGKSVCINAIIMSILYKAKPSEVKLIMIDPKVVELSIYNGIPHLMIPVVTDPKKAAGALNWAVTEMTERYQKFAQYRVRDMKGYNEKVEAATRDGALGEDAPKKMPQIVIIVDELSDLMMVAPGDVEDAICRLAQMARAAGIHLVIATQRPSVNVITGLIKANVPSRIAFSVSSGVDSRTIIDMNGAEKLLGKGDMLFYPSGYPKPLRVQGCFVSDDEVQEVVKFLSEQKNVIGSEQNSAITLDGESGGDGTGRTKEDVDEYFEKAALLIIDKEKASIGMLQRVFKIGFNRAARIMDQLAQAGVVSKEEGTKPRRVLMTLEEFKNR